ncbi:MAG: PEP-CTERM sorting domain-containing protein [Phycisphaerae bacterium]|nr:PEP-CTERM sorting domain-containing protein [Phycisphaerae bacterium]
MKFNPIAPVIFIVVVLFVNQALAQEQYSIIDLGTLGGEQSMAWGLNSTGVVVGSTQLPLGNYVAFKWDSVNGMVSLGTLGGPRSFAFAVNEVGQIVGDAAIPSGLTHAFLFSGTGMEDLGTLGGTSSWARDINNSGQVVGDAKSLGSVDSRPFIWDRDNGMTDMGSLPEHPVAFAKGINDYGIVVGESVPSTGNQSHAVIWDTSGDITDIGKFGHYTSANDINNSNQVAGSWYDTQNGTYWNAFLWTADGGRTDLPELDDGSSVIYTFANAINNLGQVVGESAGWAYVWDSNGGMQKLNDILPEGSDWNLKYANDINDKGWIVGQGFNPEGNLHAFLLIPEPATMLLLCGAAGPVLLKRRRKSRA